MRLLLVTLKKALQARTMSGDASPAPLEQEALWAGLRSEMLSFLCSRGVSEEQAEDILQTALLKAHKKMQEHDAPEQPRAWLYQVVRNLLIDESRRSATRSKLVESLSAAPSTEAQADAPPETHLAVAALLPRFIEQLPAPYAEAVKLVDLQGLSQSDAAEQVGVSLTCMKSRVQRGRSQLQKALMQCCSFEFDARGKITECRSQSSQGCKSC